MCRPLDESTLQLVLFMVASVSAGLSVSFLLQALAGNDPGTTLPSGLWLALSLATMLAARAKRRGAPTRS